MPTRISRPPVVTSLFTSFLLGAIVLLLSTLVWAQKDTGAIVGYRA